MLKRRSLRDEPRKSEIIRKMVPVYLFSRKEAQDRYESTRWFDSYIANCTCARHVEIAIKDKCFYTLTGGTCHDGRRR